MSISPLALLGNGMGQIQHGSGAFGESSFGIFGAGGFAGLLGGLLGAGSADGESAEDGGLLSLLLGGEGEGDLSSLLADSTFDMTNFLPQSGGEGADIAPVDMKDIQNLVEKINAIADKLGKLIGEGKGGDANLFLQVTHTEFEVVIEEVITEFKAMGVDVSGLNTVKGLASVFESLGMDPEDAMERAVGYVAFMKYMEAEKAKEDEIELLRALLNGEDPSAAYQAFLAGTEGGTEEADGLLAFNIRRSSVSMSFKSSTTIISGAELAHSALSGGDIPLADSSQELLGASERPLNDKVLSALQQAGIEDDSGAFAAAARAASSRMKGEGVASDPDLISEGYTQVKGEVLKPQPLADILAQSRNIFTVSASEQGAVQVQAENTEPVDVNDNLDFDAFIEKQVNNQNKPVGTERLAQMARQADVSAQMQMQVRQLAKQGGGEIKMALNPPELGELDIHIRVSDGRVSGVISAQSMDVLEQMARDLRYLQEAFAESGLDFSEEGLSFQLKEDSSTGEQGETSFAGSEEQEGKDGEGVDIAETTEPRWIDPDRLVDVDA
ncbi:MAG: flagellar hook-length control protein FliK [Alphaproteobacteria bacterium]|nr:flagellar hook-length control protein FliK [Alphaproteobacteria bacterium]